jgi:hypothetical protein
MYRAPAPYFSNSVTTGGVISPPSDGCVEMRDDLDSQAVRFVWRNDSSGVA